MYPYITLNDVTIRSAAFAERFPITRQAGFTGVELWMDQVRDFALENGGLEKVRDLAAENDLTVVQMLLLADVFSAAHIQNRTAYLDDAKRFFADTARIGCGQALACATFGSVDVNLASTLYAELCDLAGEFDLRLALEFIGWAETIKDLRTAQEIVETAGRENGGILYDTFHHFFGGTCMADLKAVPIDRLFGVHIVDADRLDMPILQISREHRLFPGKGSVPIPEILDILHRKGYRGPLSLEIFNASYWQRPPQEIARDGFAAMQSVITSVGFA